MPFLFQVIELYLQFLFENLHCPIGALAQYITHADKVGFVPLNHAAKRRDRKFTIGKGIQGIYGLIGGNSLRQMHQYLHLLGGIVIYLGDFYFSFFISLEDGFDQ